MSEPVEQAAVRRHTCARCEEMPLVCKAAVVDDRQRWMELYQGNDTDEGQYWRRQFERMRDHYSRAIETGQRQQQRADRMESRALKAEKALAKFERRMERLAAFELEQRTGDPNST